MRKLNQRTLKESIYRVVVEHKARVAIAPVIAALLGCAGLAFGPRAYTGRLEESVAASQGPNAVGVPQVGYQHFVRVWIHADDIYPSVIHARPGRLLIRAENETQSDVSLVIERVVPGLSSQLLTKVTATQSAKRADQILDLGVGTFVFYRESNPNVKGTLIIDVS